MIRNELNREELSISEGQIYATLWYKAIQRMEQVTTYNAPIERIKLNKGDDNG